jgi:hypothetical protein
MILAEIKSQKFDAISIRSFQLLHKLAMGTVGFAVIPVHLVSGQYVVFCQYSLMNQLNGEPDWASTGLFGMTGAAVALFWAGVLECSGRFYNLSRSSIRSWKKEGKMNGIAHERKFIGKFCKSCQPLGIGLEGTFVIKRLSSLKFLRAVIKGTFRALATLKR